MTQMNQPGTITCPHCGQTYAIAAEQWPLYVGRSIACTKCGQQFAVNGGGSPAAPPPLPPVLPQGYPPPGGYPQAGYAPLGYGPPPVKRGLGGGWIALIVIGAMAIVAIPCLISILLPALNRVRQEAAQGQMFGEYADDFRESGDATPGSNNGEYPDSMATLVRTTQLSPMVLICPDDTNDTPFTKSAGSITDADLIGHDSYVYVGGGQFSSASFNAVLMYESLSNHRSRGMNVLYGDYHVAWVPATQAQQIMRGGIRRRTMDFSGGL